MGYFLAPWGILRPIWKPVWKMRHNHPWVLQVLIPIAMVFTLTCCYALSNYWSSLRNPSSAPEIGFLESMAPNRWTIIIYALYYPYLIANLMWPSSNDRKRLHKISLFGALTLTFAITFSIWIIAPARVIGWNDAAWGYNSRGDLLDHAWNLLLVLDQPYNSWPSLHASASCLLGVYTHHHLNGTYLGALNMVLIVSIVFSTITTGQHGLFEAITGVTLGLGVGIFMLRPIQHYIDGEEEKILRQYMR